MNKRNIIMICFGITAISLIGIFALIYKFDSQEVQILERQYEELQAKLENETDYNTSQTIMGEYAKLFEKIAQGDKRHAEQYVTLVERISQGTIDVTKENVFSVAQQYEQKFYAMAQGKIDWGAQQIQVIKDDLGNVYLQIDYKSLFWYCTELIDKNEPIYSNGEKPIQNDGFLGQTCLLITFPESGLSQKFRTSYPIGKTHELPNTTETVGVPVYLRIATIPDDSVEGIYIGFGGDVSIRNLGRVEIEELEGSIQIPLVLS